MITMINIIFEHMFDTFIFQISNNKD